MTTRFWLVRHGPTHATGAVGWTDVAADLSDTARVARVRAALPAAAPVVSSDLRRAMATADAVATGGPRLAPTPALREFHFGDWEGREFDDIARTAPDLSRAYWETPGETAPPGGESWDQVQDRVARCLAGLATSHTGDLICVAHMGVILTAVAMASGMSAAAALRFQIDHLSVTRIECLAPPGTWRVVSVNQTW